MYIITSCNKKKGIVGNDSGSLIEYFELGWELVKSRLCLISGIKNKIFNPETDTIVTISGREFLYSFFCKNVISYDKYINDVKEEHVVYNLVEDINKWIGHGIRDTTANKLWCRDDDPFKYKYTPEQTPELIQFDLILRNDILKDTNSYCCMVVRKRDHVSGRGMNEHQLQECFNKLKDKNYTVYIMGNGSETYANPDKRIHHISFQQMTSLINDKNCKGLITPLSGGGMVRLFTGICPMITMDLQSHYSPDNALLWGESINFSKLNSSNWKIVRGYDINALDFI